jgi:hypothetical protein
MVVMKRRGIRINRLGENGVGFSERIGARFEQFPQTSDDHKRKGQGKSAEGDSGTI